MTGNGAWPRTVDGIRADARVLSLEWCPSERHWWCELADGYATDGGRGQGCFAERTVREVREFLVTVGDIR